MKKAKIVLSAVALFAVVGGAFAFKASRATNTLYARTSTLMVGLVTYPICSTVFNAHVTDDVNQSTFYRLTTTVPGGGTIPVCTSPTLTVATTTPE